MRTRWLALALGLLLVLLPLPEEGARADNVRNGLPLLRHTLEVAQRQAGGCPMQPTPSLWEKGTIERSKKFLDMRDDHLALDADGHPHLAYGGDHLYYAYHDGANWHRETVDPALGAGIYASLELYDGRPHIAYYDPAHNDLKYAYHDGARSSGTGLAQAPGWQIEIVDHDDGMC